MQYRMFLASYTSLTCLTICYAAPAVSCAIQASTATHVTKYAPDHVDGNLRGGYEYFTQTFTHTWSRPIQSPSSRASQVATTTQSNSSSALPSTPSAAMPSNFSSSSLTAPGPSKGGSLSLGITFLADYDNLGLQAPTFISGTGVKLDAPVYIVHLERHSKEDIRAYKGKSPSLCMKP